MREEKDESEGRSTQGIVVPSKSHCRCSPRRSISLPFLLSLIAGQTAKSPLLTILAALHTEAEGEGEGEGELIESDGFERGKVDEEEELR